MPAFNPSSKGNKSVVKLDAGVLNDPWDATIGGYKVFRLQDIQANQYNALMLNLSMPQTSPILDSTSGDVSLGLRNGSSILTATGEPLKFIAGSLDWNLTPFTTTARNFNFLWTNSNVNLDDMAPKFTGVNGTYPEYKEVTETNKTAVLPYISDFVDIFFRQQAQSNIVIFSYTLYGIHSTT